MYEGRECYFPKNVLYIHKCGGMGWIKLQCTECVEEEVKILLTRQIPYSIHSVPACLMAAELTPWIRSEE